MYCYYHFRVECARRHVKQESHHPGYSRSGDAPQDLSHHTHLRSQQEAVSVASVGRWQSNIIACCVPLPYPLFADQKDTVYCMFIYLTSMAHIFIPLLLLLRHRCDPHSEADAAFPEPTLEFGNLCLRNALALLQDDASTTPLTDEQEASGIIMINISYVRRACVISTIEIYCTNIYQEY